MSQAPDTSQKFFDDDVMSCWVESTTLGDLVINQESGKLIAIKNLSI